MIQDSPESPSVNSPTVRRVDPGSGQLVPVCPGFGSSTVLGVGAMAASTATAAVIEYYDSALDHYFLTQDTREIQALDGGVFPGWVRTGQSFMAYLPGQSDNSGDSVWRFYGLPSAGLNSHFYTAFGQEIGPLSSPPLSKAWQVESMDVFEIASPFSLTGDCPAGTIPVYCLWNHRPDNDHRFTTDLAIRAQMLAAGYVAEGYGPNDVAMCAVAQ